MNQNRENGGAIIATLIVMLLVTALVGMSLQLTSGVNKITDSARDFSALKREVHGALEVAYGIWETASNVKYGPIASTDIPTKVRGPSPSGSPSFNYPYTTGTGNLLQINPVDEYGVPSSTATPVPVHLEAYPGWQGLKSTFIASVRMTGNPVGGKLLNYGAKRSIDYLSVPLFQAMAFFEGDIELYKPAPMIVQGLVHTNNKSYLSTHNNGELEFLGNVSYVNNYYDTDVLPTGAAAWSSPGTLYPPTYPNGESSQVHQVDRMEPLGTAPSAVINTGDSNTNNDSMRELIERPDTGYTDPPAIAGRRLFNKAGIVITISGTAKTVTTQGSVLLTSAQVTTIKNAITQQTMYDKREAKNVDISTVDMSIVKPVLEGATNFGVNDGTRTGNVLYISDTSSTGASDPKAIRLKKGGSLPVNGLTVVSENGIYIQGDYNTGTTTDPNAVPANSGGNANNTDSPVVPGYTSKPSAVIGDAVMILSNSWNDSNASLSVSSRAASNTTVNTAIVCGNIPSGWRGPSGTGTAYGYSGGLNNFPRFLETWSGDYFTYFGAMVQLFTSKNFTGQWNTGDIYSPPNRCWNFDTGFLRNPPPGSLDLVTRSRGPLMRF